MILRVVVCRVVRVVSCVMLFLFLLCVCVCVCDLFLLYKHHSNIPATSGLPRSSPVGVDNWSNSYIWCRYIKRTYMQMQRCMNTCLRTYTDRLIRTYTNRWIDRWMAGCMGGSKVPCVPKWFDSRVSKHINDETLSQNSLRYLSKVNLPITLT